MSTVEGVGHRKLSAIIRVGHVKICRRLGHSHFFVLKISAQRTRYLIFLPKKVVDGGGGGWSFLSEKKFFRKNWERGGS